MPMSGPKQPIPPSPEHLIAVQYALPSRQGLPAARTVRSWATAALENTEPTELSIRFVASDEITSLNRQYRDRTGPTNVLSFPAPTLPVAVVPAPLGDVLISPEVARQEASQQSKTLRAHLAHLVVHGVLHLQGYDHIQPDQAERMESRERQVLAGLGFADPYLADPYLADE